MYRWIAFGGALGAFTRWLILSDIDLTSVPWPTLGVNVVGTALLVVVAPRFDHRRHRDAFGIGFCGGLTTVSTFALEVTELVHMGMVTEAALYAFVSAVAGVLAIEAIRRAGVVL